MKSKQCRIGRQKRSEEWLDAHADPRRQWKGVAAIRKPYNAQNIELDDIEGRPTPLKRQAEAMAEHLSARQWGTLTDEDARTASIPTRRLNKFEPQYDMEPATDEYVVAVIAEFKNHKAPGPDYIEVELLKHLPEQAVPILTAHLNNWLNSAEVTPELTDARVASLYKKGDFRNTDNYRPISLLNTIYKLQARFLRDKLESG